MMRAGTLWLLLAVAAPGWCGPVEVYRQQPGDCPRDRAADARRITAEEAIERARALLPPAFCGPTWFVSGCDFEPEWAVGAWRVYAIQYGLADGRKNHGGRDHSYVILDAVGNCIANIPGT